MDVPPIRIIPGNTNLVKTPAILVPTLPTMNRQQLSSRKDLVEQLEAEPVLLDYLLQHGVVNKEQVRNVKNEGTKRNQNIALLRVIEHNGEQALRLFVNALRQAGQLKLANALDEGVRITPSKHPGYLERTRHKGQLSIQIRVRAICVPALRTTVSNTDTTLPETEWIVTKERRPVHSLPRPSGLGRNSMLYLEVVDPNVRINDEDEDKSCCSFFCCGRSKKKQLQTEMVIVRKSSDPIKNVDIAIMSDVTLDFQEDANDNVMQQVQSTNGKKHNPSEIKSRQAVFKEKSTNFYEILGDSKSPAHVRLLKYFEQERGILVLQTIQTNGLMILTICTQMSQLDQIRENYSAGNLNTDIEDRIVTGEVLKHTGVLGMQLDIFLDVQELDIIEHELAM